MLKKRREVVPCRGGGRVILSRVIFGEGGVRNPESSKCQPRETCARAFQSEPGRGDWQRDPRKEFLPGEIT